MCRASADGKLASFNSIPKTQEDEGAQLVPAAHLPVHKRAYPDFPNTPVFASSRPQMEVVKTRMQLQGELVLRGQGQQQQPKQQQAYQAPYRNAPHAFYKICRDEGFRGIQAGLLPGLMYQVRTFVRS